MPKEHRQDDESYVYDFTLSLSFSLRRLPLSLFRLVSQTLELLPFFVIFSLIRTFDRNPAERKAVFLNWTDSFLSKCLY